MRIGSQRVHLVGIGGAGMSALARLLKGIGADISGSDKVGNSVVTTLLEQGISVWTGHHVERLHGGNGYVIRSAAAARPSEDHVRFRTPTGRELQYAHLVVTGADGAPVEAALSVPAPDRVRIVVADAGAAYPLSILFAPSIGANSQPGSRGNVSP